MLRGVLIPVITPFEDDGSVDEPTLRRLVDFYLRSEVQGLFALGSAGQGPAMAAAERKAAAEIIIDQVAGRCPVIVHVGTADTPTTVELALHASRRGAQGIGVIPPYYYCDVPQSAVLEHFRAVGRAVSLPILIYENPKYSGISISPQLGAELKAAVPTIGGIKVAYGAGPMLDFVKLFPDDVSVFTGNADIFGLVPFGVAGMINPPTSSMPELCVALWQALERGEYAAAVGLQSRVNALTRTVIANIRRHGRGAVAETFRLRGIPVKRFPRWDAAPLPPDARAAIRRDLAAGGFLD